MKGGLGCANRNAVQKGNVQGALGRNGQENTLGILRDCRSSCASGGAKWRLMPGLRQSRRALNDVAL